MDDGLHGGSASMAATTDTTVVNGLNWAQQQAAASGGAAYAAGAAMAAAAVPKTKKTRNERVNDAWILGALFPMEAIQSGVEEGLKTSIRDAIGTLHALLSEDVASAALQKLLGDAEDPTSIAYSLRDLTESFSAMAEETGRSSKSVIRATQAFTEKLKTTTTQIQSLRAKADTDIGQTVGKVNAILRQIADLNNKIGLNAAIGQPSLAIGCERDSVLDDLSSTFDFASFSRADGTVALFTKGGTPLVNGTAATLVHKITERIEATMTLANGRLSGITADGIDISGHITAGALHTLIKTRDATLPNVQSQLDTLAQTLQAHVNQISNRIVGGKGLTGTRRSSRRFDDPGQQKFSLSGGDVIISLSTSDGKPAASVGLSLLMKQYFRACGQPGNRTWTASQAAQALNRWLTTRLGARNEPYAGLNEEGQIVFQLPQGTVTGLSFQDQRSLGYRSAAFADANKPLGLSGPLAFTDGAGNMISTERATPACTIAAGDSLSAIAAKLGGLDGLETGVIAADGGFALQITTTIGSDLSIEPDQPGATTVAGLGLRPAPDQPRDDVVVNYQPSPLGSGLLSAPRAEGAAPLGLDGPLVLSNQNDETIAQVVVRPDWTLATIAAQINGAAKGKDIKAAVIHAGNQVALKITPAMGQQIKLDGSPEAYLSSPRHTFSAAPGSLTIALEGKSVGRLDIKAGSDLQTIVEAINLPTAPFTAQGIIASLGEIDGASFVEIRHASHLPLAFQGEWKDKASGDIFSPQLNVRDWLGLNPPATQAISGFANFLGLNDILTADPFSAFDGKAPTGVFTTTATPGTAMALCLGPDILDNASILGDPDFARQVAELLKGPVNLAAAGGLPRGSHTLPHYAGAIIAAASAQAKATRGQIAYQQVLVDGLHQQHARVKAMDMNDTVAILTAYQQAFHDSSRIVSSMALLVGSLETSIH